METESKLIVYGLVDPNSLLVRYVGKSVSGFTRPKQHACPSARKAGTHRDNWITSLVNAGQRYVIVVLDTAQSPDDLSSLECWWIAYGLALGWPLTNLTAGGDGTVGYSQTDATKALISRANKGFVVTPEHLAKLKAANTGRVKSPTERAKLSAVNIGRVKSAEELAKMSAATTAAMTPERRASIGDQHRGTRHTEETKARISVALTGRVTSQETRAKLSKSRKGRTPSDETRRKMSEGQMRRYAKPKIGPAAEY